MKKELELPVIIGYCKKCFRQRRNGSAFCGECMEDGPRMKVYFDGVENFPLLKKVMKKFKLAPIDLMNVVFTYGDTIYSANELSYGLVAHEMIHVFQQTKTDRVWTEEWWERYLTEPNFRLIQEIEAYREQYRVYKRRDEAKAVLMAEDLAKDLSGKLYGKIITFEEAKQLITQPIWPSK